MLPDGTKPFCLQCWLTGFAVGRPAAHSLPASQEVWDLQLGLIKPLLQVVNLVSNDVRRFDDAGPYFMFIWAGPLEVVCVLVMVGSQLTFPAAIAGIATLLLLIPLQVCPRAPLPSSQ